MHVAEQQFYDQVAARARSCQLLVAEGVPAKDVPAQSWMAQHHLGHLIDQAAALRLESLGVPVRWEAEPDTRSRSAAERTVSRTADIAGAATIGLVRKFIDPRNLPSLEQVEAHDQSAENLTGHRFQRMLEHNVFHRPRRQADTRARRDSP